MVDKVSLRKLMRDRKRALCPQEREQAAREVFRQLEDLPVFQQARTFVAYWSLPDELPTHTFVEKWWKSKLILLPVMQGETLVLRPFTGRDQMSSSNSFGVEEPLGEDYSSSDPIDLMLIPGVAFDAQHNRLGRGKGFYDRLLQGFNGPKIGLGFSFQRVEQVPAEAHDIPLDAVLFGD